MTRRNANVTFIDELQDIEDLDSSNNMENRQINSQQQSNGGGDLNYQKYIRGHAMPPNESGMNLNNANNQNTTEHYNQYMNQHSNYQRSNSSMENYGNMNQYVNVNDYVNPHMTPYSKQYMNGNMNGNKDTIYQDIIENNDNENQVQEHFQPTDNLNCRDVSKHISNCPVCSKLYKNDKTMYWIVISILVILCIIMFNKILECNNRFMSS